LLVTPVPVRETVWGLPGALSVTEIVPLKVPVALGVNVTVTVQVEPDARLEPLQESVSAKLAPAAIPEMFNVPVPKLLSVSDWAGLVVFTTWLSNARLVADQVVLGPAASPTPFRAAECGLPAVLSMMVRVALSGPAWMGVKVTLMAQFAPAGRLEPQVLLWLKSATSVPATATLPITTAAVPVLLSVSV